MAHTNIALRAIDEHRKAVGTNARFNLFDREVGKVSRDQQIIRAQHCWMARIVDQNRARAAIGIIDLDDADLFIDRPLIGAATIDPDAVQLSPHRRQPLPETARATRWLRFAQRRLRASPCKRSQRFLRD